MAGHLLSSVNKEASDAIQPGAMASRRPEVGELVIYHMRQGHQRQGRTRFPALVQGHGERNTLNLTVILEAAEMINASLVEEIGPGADTGHVWERPDMAFFTEAFRGTLTSLHTSIAGAEDEIKALRTLVLGEYDAPGVSIIHIMQDFENRLRLMAEENRSLREHLMSEPATDGPQRKVSAVTDKRTPKRARAKK